jgi:hypothetical protein
MWAERQADANVQAQGRRRSTRESPRPVAREPRPMPTASLEALTDGVARLDRTRRWSMFLAIGFGLAASCTLFALQFLESAIEPVVAPLALVLLPPLCVWVALLREANPAQVADGFWMARLRALFSERLAGHAAAVSELMSELRLAREEKDYAPEMLSAIRHGSVWAVCGRKSVEIAAEWLRANVESQRAGHFVERVFLIPLSRAERGATRLAIAGHLAEGMTVCVSHDGPRDEQVRLAWNLPPGFGMTLIGAADVDHLHALHAPKGVTLVLVHWGGVDGTQRHVGVLLRQPEWIEHFSSMFASISSTCAVASDRGSAPRAAERVRGNPPADQLFAAHHA